MRVLIITATTNEKSGWGRHSTAICQALRHKGVAIETFSEEHRLHPLRSPFPIIAVLQNILAVRKAARQADVVHALDGWPYGVYGLGAVIGRPAPLFINGVGTYSIAPLYTRWKGFFLRAAYSRAKKIFCISEYTKQELIRAGISSQLVTVVHFGVPKFVPPREEEQKAYATDLRITPDAYPIILTVGAIKNRKGQLDTLRAVAVLKQRYPNILYIMAGYENTQSYIDEIHRYAAQRGLEENIEIISGASDDVIAYLYSVCTVFALNSTNDIPHHHFEGFGAVILEACQFGKPSVGSADCGIEDAIKDGVTGLLSEQGNPKDIARKLQQILDRYDFFSANANIHHADFDWGKTVATYIDFYTKTV